MTGNLISSKVPTITMTTTISLILLLISLTASANTVFMVQVADSTDSNPQTVSGCSTCSAQAFFLNELEGRLIVASVGTNITFNLTQNCQQPFVLTTDGFGGKGSVAGQNGNLPLGTSVTISDGSSSYASACGGKLLRFTPNTSHVGMTLYYNSANGTGLGWKIIITANKTVCEKYADLATGGDQEALLNAVMDATFSQIANDVVINQYFSGVAPSGSYPYLSDPKAALYLRTHLVQFFASALGCNNAEPILHYLGRNNLVLTHANMGITKQVFDRFNYLVIKAAESLSVSLEDRNVIWGYLNSTENQICGNNGCPPVPDTLCEKYSKALSLSNYQLIEAVVNGTIARLVAADAPTKKYFDGSKPTGSTNYLTNTGALNNLRASLVAFFGQQGILGCSDYGFPLYKGRTLSKSHIGDSSTPSLRITGSDFNYFNDQIIFVLNASGVTPSDQASVKALLDSTYPQVVDEPSMTFCDKYSKLLRLDSVTLLKTIVLDVVVAVTADNTPTKIYFDGTQPAGSTNYLAGGAPLTNLINGLVAYFGQPSIFNCTSPTFPVYTRTQTLAQIHKSAASSMKITTEAALYFNSALYDVLASYGVAQPDLEFVRSFLASTLSSMVDEPSICVKYGGNDQVGLISTVVNNTIAELVSPTSNLKKYFDGTYPPGSTNYTAGGAPLTNLTNSLVAFFGTTLGCDQNSTVFTYKGRDMASSHLHLAITASEFDEFNGYIVSVVGALGVSLTDQMLIRETLESLYDQIVNETICERYKKALNLNGVDLVTSLVVSAFGKLTDVSAPTLKYFDGSFARAPKDYVNNQANTNALVSSLVAFFGSALGCSDTPAYTGRSLYDSHKGVPSMRIPPSDFKFFNDKLLEVLLESGVSSRDITAVSNLLDSTYSDIVDDSLICTPYCNNRTCGEDGCGGVCGTCRLGETCMKGVCNRTVNFVVSVARKSGSNPQEVLTNCTNCFPISYVVNGMEMPPLTLTAGRTYTFLLTQSYLYPFSITIDPEGIYGNVDMASNGITLSAPGGFYAAHSGGILTWTPTSNSIGKSFFYQSTNYRGVGWVVSVAPYTICEKYSAALSISQYSLMQTIMTKVVGDILNNTRLVTYFGGVSDAKALTNLLSQFFGIVLGCNDPSFPQYRGRNDMLSVHGPLSINKDDFYLFNQVAANAVASFGLLPEELAAIGAYLNSTENQMCGKNGCPVSSPTNPPTVSPTVAPTVAPTASPITSPTASPSTAPINAPGTVPVASPVSSAFTLLPLSNGLFVIFIILTLFITSSS
eukprot:TRINITY_DN1956_c1_g1_i2.p1 TRINITY_DN1956_c1_g1~~TRINITY_DN1956_c1_g1_i2.p1  ORF type:complete len:1275 (+),score=178.99 TRINITY_DN1956_c1_g1_i2:1243-5067(+)